jgi:hypothetical protein
MRYLWVLWFAGRGEAPGIAPAAAPSRRLKRFVENVAEKDG